MHNASAILKELRSLGNESNRSGMARFGINAAVAYGVPIPALRHLARQLGMNHQLAAGLWKSGVHEARILACLIDDPKLVSPQQMENWVRDFNSWDVCDQCCGNLFDKTASALEKAVQWSDRKEEFVKRAGFVLMASLAVHDKLSSDSTFAKFLPHIKRESMDERNFVKKAVNWALRQIGKRNRALNKKAIDTAKRIALIDSPAARWIAADALRELTAKKIQLRLK